MRLLRPEEIKKIADTLCTFNAYIVLFHILLPWKARRIQLPRNNEIGLVITSFGLSLYLELLFFFGSTQEVRCPVRPVLSSCRRIK